MSFFYFFMNIVNLYILFVNQLTRITKNEKNIRDSTNSAFNFNNINGPGANTKAEIASPATSYINAAISVIHVHFDFLGYC